MTKQMRTNDRITEPKAAIAATNQAAVVSTLEQEEEAGILLTRGDFTDELGASSSCCLGITYALIHLSLVAYASLACQETGRVVKAAV